MISLLALRNFLDRPWRTAFLLGGYALGVGVMIVLLSIGEALVTQARDERLVGGGEITVLPEGIDVEVLKTGGLGGMFFSIPNARFIYLQLLASPRLAPIVSAAAPQIEDRLLYLRPLGTRGAEIPVRASGEIPSRSRLVGAAPELLVGAWEDDAGDRRWMAPTPAELYADIDRFHLPPEELAVAESWAEWHYFNVLSEDGTRWAFISFIVGGDVPDGEWGGRVLVALHGIGVPERRFVADVPPEQVSLSTVHPDLDLGASTVRLLPDGRYAVRAVAREARTGQTVDVDLTFEPSRGAYFPGTALGDASRGFVSGYVVPALRASATGQVCVARACRRYEAAMGYHDHNWGIWAGVTWEWGIARAGHYSVLYGQVQPPDTIAATAPPFVYVTDSLGFLAIFRPNDIIYEDARTITVGGRRVQVPARALIADARGEDTLRLELEIEDAVGTDTRRPLIERGSQAEARELAFPYFIQMKGRARMSGRIDGRRIDAEGQGFFETYR
jgi:hypothetical protein